MLPVLVRRAGVERTVHVYEVAAGRGSYGLAGAAAPGVAPKRMLTTLLADPDGELVCAVVPAAGSLDLALASALGGKRASMPDPTRPDPTPPGPARAPRSSGYGVGGVAR